MFDDEFMNDILLNPDLYGLDDNAEKYMQNGDTYVDNDEDVEEDDNEK